MLREFLRETVAIFGREWYAIIVYTLYKGCCDYEKMDKFSVGIGIAGRHVTAGMY